MNIYVGNLAYTVTEDELREAFAAFGEVSRANVIMDRDTGRSKGFGFVEMPKSGEAKVAIKSLNNQIVGNATTRAVAHGIHHNHGEFIGVFLNGFRRESKAHRRC